MMGAGKSGLYKGTYGSNAVPGSIDYMSPTDAFSKNISHQKDIDVNGFFDIIAHGLPNKIQIEYHGKTLIANHRLAAQLIKHNYLYTGTSIRLLSCSTGSQTAGFAQNLANKMNIVVEAPTKLVWAYPDGKYIVADRRKDNPNLPDLNRKGKFIKFYPGGSRK